MNFSIKSRMTHLALFLLIALLALLTAPMLGARFISLSYALSADCSPTDAGIFWTLRVPRVCVAFLAGSALAISGMAFQAMFRNPLATPCTLGVSSGAALGAALGVRFEARLREAEISFNVFGVSITSICAFLGALVAIGLVYTLTRIKKGFSTITMLLAGVAVSFFFSSLILFIQYISNLVDSFRIVRWLMGGFDVTGFDEVFNVLPLVVSGSVVIFYLTHELNLLASGEDLATARGVNVNRAKAILFFVTSVMVGGIVAVCGPIGFVGMMAPHICRLMIGPEHRFLTPATLLFGGFFLVGCDALARTLIAPAEMPVGIITALLGGPFFIWLLLGDASGRRVF